MKKPWSFQAALFVIFSLMQKQKLHFVLNDKNMEIVYRLFQGLYY